MKQFCSVFYFSLSSLWLKSVKKNAGIRDDRMINVHAKDAPNNPCARSLSISENRKVSRYRAIRITAPASAKIAFCFFHKNPFLLLLFCFRQRRINILFGSKDIVCTGLTYAALVFDPVVDLLQMFGRLTCDFQ